jgi:hypothetical protein
MMRKVLAAPLLAAMIGGATALAPAGSAQTTDGRTLTFFEDAAHGSESLIDNAPRSPSANPGSRRFRLSAGDELVVRTPILDRKGGKRLGTLYAQAAIVGGSRFQNAVFVVHGAFKLADGQIAFTGVIKDQRINIEAVIGGTGAYNGARGSATSADLDDGAGAQDEVHLLP